MSRLFVTILLFLFSGTTMAKDFCLRAQHLVAETELNPDVVVHDNFESFVESKATLEPFEIHQYFSKPKGGAQMPSVMSCKLKSAESLNKAFAGDGPAVAGADHGCEVVVQELLDEALARWGGDASKFTVVPEVQTYMGPSWLEGWPFEAARQTADGRWELHSRALRVVDAWYIPLPASIKGVHYCHMVAPEYLEALVKANAEKL